MTRIFYAGADVRESCAQPDNDWTQDRREGFLLRLNVVRPLSVDPNVWGLAQRPADEKAGTPLPWISIDDALHKFVASADCNATAIAIGVVAEDAEEESILATTTGVDAEIGCGAGLGILRFRCGGRLDQRAKQLRLRRE